MFYDNNFPSLPSTDCCVLLLAAELHFVICGPLVLLPGRTDKAITEIVHLQV